MKAGSVMGRNRFSEVPRAEISRSSFDRSFGHKTTFDAGWLVPVMLDEVLPGDTFNVRMTAFARLATALRPVMDNMFLDSFFFFVPYRLVWNNWEKFNGAQDDPADSTDFTIPRIADGYTVSETGLFQYMGLPPGLSTTTHDVSALPFRALNLIYNEWFRDQNLQDSLNVRTDDGPDPKSDFALFRRGKRHDYFTSALPWPQKGDAVNLPIGDEAPVHTPAAYLAPISIYADDVSARKRLNTSGANLEVSTTAGALGDRLYADLTAATGATINALRQAFQIQKLLERDARGGTRYAEIIKAHFGVTSPDYRLQRPEYLGGGSTPVGITPVPNTSGTATEEQGDLAAYGTVTANHGFTKSFTEHGIIIGLVSVRADLTYQQGLDRFWSRRTRYDFFWPALQNIGEQAVLSKEIYVDNTAQDEDVFGYQERYAEYRYKASRISGLFRSGVTGSLDLWHLSQEFASRPTLSSTFIVEDPPVDRTIAVPSEPHFLFDSLFKMRCARPMPVYGVPGFIDHF